MMLVDTADGTVGYMALYTLRGAEALGQVMSTEDANWQTRDLQSTHTQEELRPYHHHSLC